MTLIKVSMFVLYDNILNLSLEQSNVDLLVKLWSDSSRLDKGSLSKIREKITAKLPELRKRIGMSPSLSTEFKEFVEDYDEYMYKKCTTMSPRICLVIFAKKGDLRYVKKALEKDVGVLPDVVRVASKHKHELIVNYILDKITEVGRVDYLTKGLEGAADGGHIDLIESFLEKGATRSHNVHYYAAKNGSPEVMKFFDYTTDDQKCRRFEGASRGGRLDIVRRVLKEDKGIVSIENGLLAAATGGHLELVTFFVENGAKNLYYPVRSAAKKGHLPVVKYLLGKDNTMGSMTVEFSLRYKQLEVTKFLVENGLVTVHRVIRDSACGDYFEEFSYLLTKLLSSNYNKEYIRSTLFTVIDVLVRRESRVFLEYVLSMSSTIARELDGKQSLLDYILLSEVSQGKLELLKESLELEGRTVSYETLLFKSEKFYVTYFLAEKMGDLNLALLKAVEAGNKEIVKTLISLGADNLEEALSLAQSQDNTKIVEYLEYYLEPFSEDSDY